MDARVPVYPVTTAIGTSTSGIGVGVGRGVLVGVGATDRVVGSDGVAAGVGSTAPHPASSTATTTAQPTGSAFLDTPGTQHNFRNDGTVPLVIHATYVNVPVAGVFRLDRDAPACAGTAGAAAPAAAALPNTATGSDIASSLLPLLAVAVLLSSGAGIALAWIGYRRQRIG